MEWFTINWTGPYPINNAQKKMEALGFGVYAIYKMTGKKAELLYIGETYRQSFGVRLQQHKHKWLDPTNGRMVIHFGTVQLPSGKRISDKRIFDIEKLLIHLYPTKKNKTGTHGYSGRDIMIFNLGKIGTLRPLNGPKELLYLLSETVPKLKKKR